MGWRVWTFLAGFPVGVLAAKAWLVEQSSPDRLLYCGAGVGIIWLLIISAIEFVRERDPGRAHHLAIAASSGLAALPALLGLTAGLGNGVLLAAMALIVMALGVIHAALTRAPAAGLERQFGAAIGYLVLGCVLTLGATLFVAQSGARPPEFDQRRAALIFDADAKVATFAESHCQTQAKKGEILLDRGARPRLSASGEVVWFDAESDDGSRQIHSIRVDSGEVTCWTCGEEGNNLRPVPGSRMVVFETDRFASWDDPFDTELQVLRTPASGEPDGVSQRITDLSGPDSHAVIGPDSSHIVWSRMDAGRYAVVTARLGQSHGGLSMGRPNILEAGGSSWMVPVAWSPDARSLAVASGNPFSPLRVHGVDFATGKTVDLAEDVAGPGSLAFNGDGNTVVAAVAPGAHNAPGSLVPDMLSLVVGGAAANAERRGALSHSEGAELRIGRRGEPGTRIPLGEAGDWGAFTGVSVLPDLSSIVIGQKQISGEEAERLLWIDLDCRESG